MNKENLISVPVTSLSEALRNNNHINFGTFNAHSVKNKHSTIADCAYNKNLDWLLITETWIKQINRTESGLNVVI